MAPLPENNTPRLFIQYTSGGQAHEAEIRLGTTTGTVDAIAAYNALKGPMAALLFTTDQVLGARYSAAGSNLSFPLSVSAATGSLAGTPDDDKQPYFMSFTGRSVDGRRVKFTLFTQAIDPVTNGYRDITPGTLELALMNALFGSTVNAKTISGAAPLWNTYVNYGQNSYFQRKNRRTNAH